MVRRLVLLLSTTGLVALPVLAGAAPATSAERPNSVRVAQPIFSPGDDGVRDAVRVTYTLRERTRVRLEITRPSADRVLRTVDLGVQEAGTHAWRWDGRANSGRVLRDGMYWVRLALPAATTLYDRVRIDTSFSPSLVAPTYGVPSRVAAPRVFPRTTVVRDALELEAYAYEPLVASLRLVIRNADGRVVHRADANRPNRTTSGAVYSRGRTVRWTARRAGEALPRGRYTAVLAGRDRAGNRGRTDRQRIWVSGDELVWRETTTTVVPAESDYGPCAYSTANGCGDFPDCGDVVPSTVFVGGLSHRSKPCESDAESEFSRAGSSHQLEVPAAAGVRGLAAVRVAFTGAPTSAGEADTGLLRVWGEAGGSEVMGTSGQSEWVEDPSAGAGETAYEGVPQRDPAATWSFVTTGTDAVDVASYTVDVRYLAVAD